MIRCYDPGRMSPESRDHGPPGPRPPGPGSDTMIGSLGSDDPESKAPGGPARDHGIESDRRVPSPRALAIYRYSQTLRESADCPQCTKN
eukprot:302590-Hanusia_phi.AAC.1